MKVLQGDNGNSYFKNKEQLFGSTLSQTVLNKAIDKCFNLTMHYEGTNYTGLEGSFDGQGFTYGIFGFCLGQGSLQNLLKALVKKDKDLFVKCCQTVVDGKPMNLAQILINVSKMGTKEAVAWSLQRQSTGHKPLPHWIAVFSNLGKEETFRKIQRDFGMARMNTAISYIKKYNIKTERGLALMFDTCIQQGSVKLTTQAKLVARGVSKQNYIGKLRMIATAMSEQANPRWKNDVYSRRIAIVNGKGTVHGSTLNIDARFGITDLALDVK